MTHDINKMAEERKLLPCPFCGSEADVVQYGLHETIFCTKGACECQIEGHDGVDARQRWNIRFNNGGYYGSGAQTSEEEEFKKHVELIISMSTDLLLCKIDKTHYVNVLHMITNKITQK